MNKRNFDIILFGATGFTGKLVLKYILHNYVFLSKINFAIAGRDLKKIEQLKQQVTDELKTDNKIIKHYPPNLDLTKLEEYSKIIKNLKVFQADSSNPEKLDEMIKSTKVLISTVGPFNRYGKPVVKSCVENKTHYVDITGEVSFAKYNFDKWNDLAQTNNVNIISMCGYDSIPSDLGTFMMQDYVKNDLKKKPHFIKECVKTNASASGGTVETMFDLFERGDGIPGLYELNQKKKTPSKEEKDLFFVQYNKHLKGWESPFVMSTVNTRVVRRSAEALNYGDSFKFNEVSSSGGFIKSLLIVIGFYWFGFFMIFSWTRWFLRKLLPKPGEGKSIETLSKSWFSHTFLAFDEKDNLICTGKVSGSDPGYLETSKMVSESAMCLVLDKVNSKGGVNTPAIVFGNHLIERLREKNMEFKIINSTDDNKKK